MVNSFTEAFSSLSNVSDSGSCELLYPPLVTTRQSRLLLGLLASHAHKLSRHQAVATSSSKFDVLIQKAALTESNLVNYIPLTSCSFAPTPSTIASLAQHGTLAVQ
jgi:hypothetical protein